MPLKGILTGLGNRGKSWLNTCRENRDVELVAYVEPFAPNREKAVQEWGVEAFKIHPTLADALSAAKADFVVDVTPPAVHEQVALEAFQAGLHVLGEKPLSDTRAAARRMAAAGKAAGRRHMVAQNYRFAAAPRTLRRLVQAGQIGKPGFVDIGFYMAWADLPGSHYVEKPFMFLTDMGIHHFDMLRYILGTEALSAQGISWNPAWGWHKGDASHVLLFRCRDGLVATHRGVGCSVGYKTTYNGDWRIEGPDGSLTWERDKLFYTKDHRTPEKKRVEIPVDGQPLGALAAILAEFLVAIREKREPECNAADNLKSLDMVFAAIESIREEREVKLAELKAGKPERTPAPKSKPSKLAKRKPRKFKAVGKLKARSK